ncbi:MAG: AI-2E family transporter [Armatimonadetes bacterium]|nr:AI-2E family transporter [Armatimonadota bacterium]
MRNQTSSSSPKSPWLSPEDQRLTRWIGFGLLFGFFLWLAWRVREILPLFLLGLFIAYLFDPLLDKLQKRGWSRGRAVWLVYMLFFLFFSVMALIVIPVSVAQVRNAVTNASVYQDKVLDLTATGEEFIKNYEVPKQVLDAITQAKERLRQIVPKIAERLATWLSGAVSSLFLLIILPIIIFYFMNEFDPLRLRALSLVPEDFRDDVVQMSSEVNDMLARYVRGQAVVSLLVAVTVFVVLSIFSLIFKMKYAMVLALLAGITCLIPYLGAAVNALSTGAVAYLTADHNQWGCVIGVVVSMVILNQLFDNLITPRLVGGKVGLHPLIVLFALMAGGQMYGILGMLIAVPVAGSFKVLLLHLFPKLKTPLSELEKLDRRYRPRKKERKEEST